jgi:hypothetical protein
MTSPSMNTKSRQVLHRIQQENSSPPTPSIRKSRTLPGPSPLSLKRSASFGNLPSADRPRKRRTRSSDVVFQKKVSSLLEQAQSMYHSDDESSSQPEPQSEPQSMNDLKDMEDFAFDGDLDLLEAELQFDPFSSDGLQKMEVETKMEANESKPDVLLGAEVCNDSKSDDLFDVDFDDFKPEELEALDSPSVPSKEVNGEEDDALFGDGYDDLMDIDFEETQPEVWLPKSY